MKLFIGGLPFSTDDDQLQQAFSQFGKVVSAKVITDRETGKSRGFGFVEYATKEEGQAAIDGQDNQEFGGRTIHVSEARERQ